MERRKAVCERFIYLQFERAENVRASQINKRKCREKRRGPAC